MKINHRLVIIHTTAVTIEPLKALAAEIIQNCEVFNLLDDSILPQLIKNNGKLEDVEERWLKYAKVAENIGADCILCACSSVGELVYKARNIVKVPVLRIDEAMAEEAVEKWNVIGVAATLSTTMNPTMELLESKQREMNRKVDFKPLLIEEAYKLLVKGDRKGHNALLSVELEKLVKTVDVVLLAQASMAGIIAELPDEQKVKFLTSPRSGMERVNKIMKGFLA
jgi:Asp/Glu/hydantoin racemase